MGSAFRSNATREVGAVPIDKIVKTQLQPQGALS